MAWALTFVSAHAACQVRTIGESFGKFVPALQSALIADEVPALTRAGVDGGVTILTVPRSNVGVRLVEKDGLLDEVGTDVISPVSDRDRDTFMTVGAAMVAHLSGTVERQVKDDLYAGLRVQHAAGNFLLRWGSTAASVTSNADGSLVARIGKMDCD